jgi:glycosyltransferase involved in cell wall biosynthesis
MVAQDARRVLLYSNLPVNGGVTTHVCALAELLARDGAAVSIASLGNDLFEARGASLKQMGIRCVTTPISSGTPGYAKQARAVLSWPLLLRPQSFDTIIGFGPGGFFGPLTIFKRRDGFMMYYEVNSGKAHPGGLRGLPHHAMLRLVDGVGCLSEAGAKAFVANHSLRKPVRVLPFFTMGRDDLPAVSQNVSPSRRRRLNIGYFGRLEPYKQPDLLIDIWMDLKVGPATLTFYGTGTLEADLRARVRAKNLDAAVAFHGAYDQRAISPLMSACDLVVLPSREEGFGIVLLEALAHGIPFVTTAFGGAAALANASPHLRAVAPTRTDMARAIEEVVSEIRGGTVSPVALQSLYREKYGYDHIAAIWRKAIQDVDAFWSRVP